MCGELDYIIKFPDFEKHLVPIFFFLNCLCSFPSTIFLHRSRSWRFLVLLKAYIGGSWNASLNPWFIWSKFQLLVFAFSTLVHVRLYVNTGYSTVLLRFFVFSSRSFCLSQVLVVSIPLFISCHLYPLSTSL